MAVSFPVIYYLDFLSAFHAVLYKLRILKSVIELCKNQPSIFDLNLALTTIQI